jgi:glycosyltransferase involved in cell wall biosynthesis
MKVSFLVTYYNQEEYVKQSIDSILAIRKSYDWELLVGDDGSSDGTTAIVKEYAERYPDKIKCFAMNREQGKKYEIVRRSSANRMNLLSQMSGDYFCILDGDDYYCDIDFVEDALKIYSDEEGLSVVAFGYKTFSADKGTISEHTLPTGRVDLSEYLRGKYIHAGACLFKSFNVSARLPFLLNVGYYDDNNILINNLHFGGMYAVDQVVYSYRQTESSTFNAMDFVEKAVLNAQGYDVDIKYISGFDNELLDRYGESLLVTYILKNKLQSVLGDKWIRYHEGCKKIEDSITYIMLNWENETKQKRMNVCKLIAKYVMAHPKYSAKLWLKIKLGRV